jgi:hypothetical protein
MNSMKAAVTAAVLAGFAAAGATNSKAEDSTLVLTMKPLCAISFDVGSKHAVSYFLSEKGQCKLSLVVADAMQGDAIPANTPVRFDVSINEDKDALFDTADGKSLRFACAHGTQAMTVGEVSQIAVSTPAQ